jgi:hypothetical protein
MNSQWVKLYTFLLPVSIILYPKVTFWSFTHCILYDYLAILWVYLLDIPPPI